MYFSFASALILCAVPRNANVAFRSCVSELPAKLLQGFDIPVGQDLSLIHILRTASPKPQQNENPKYAMRTWLLRLGFIGGEFATARDFLTRNLTGDTAFRHGRAAA